jgi:hypothetical protein
MAKFALDCIGEGLGMKLLENCFAKGDGLRIR